MEYQDPLTDCVKAEGRKLFPSIDAYIAINFKDPLETSEVVSYSRLTFITIRRGKHAQEFKIL